MDLDAVRNLLQEGVTKKRLGDYEGAKRLYYRAISLAPAEHMCYYSLAKTCYLANDQSEAVLNYLRAGHLSVSACLQNERSGNPDFALMKENLLSQYADEDLARVRDAHPNAPFLLMDFNLCSNLGHALFDFSIEEQILEPPLRTRLLSHIASYRQSLAGQNVQFDHQFDQEFFLPIGLEFLLRNIQWESTISPNGVLERYTQASVAHEVTRQKLTLRELELLLRDAGKGIQHTYASGIGPTYNLGLHWLAEARNKHSGATYLDYLEKFAVFFGEYASSLCFLSAMYLLEGQLIFDTDNQIRNVIDAHEEVGKAMAKAQLQYIRSGCDNCDVHHRHKVWADYKNRRAVNSEAERVKELEFTVIRNRTFLEVSQLFVGFVFNNHNLAGSCKGLPSNEVLDTFEREVRNQSDQWLGLSMTLISWWEWPIEWKSRFSSIAREVGLPVERSAAVEESQDAVQLGEAQAETPVSKKWWQFWR